jgi:hypothetical protein
MVKVKVKVKCCVCLEGLGSLRNPLCSACTKALERKRGGISTIAWAAHRARVYERRRVRREKEKKRAALKALHLRAAGLDELDLRHREWGD